MTQQAKPTRKQPIAGLTIWTRGHGGSRSVWVYHDASGLKILESGRRPMTAGVVAFVASCAKHLRLIDWTHDIEYFKALDPIAVREMRQLCANVIAECTEPHKWDR